MLSTRYRAIKEFSKPDNVLIITKFCLPDVNVEHVTLYPTDIVDQFELPLNILFTQGGTVRDGKIWYMFGKGNKECPNGLRVIDLQNRNIELCEDLSNTPFADEEVECCAFFGEKLLINTQGGKYMKEQSDKTIVWVENGETAHKFFCSEYKKNIFLIGDSIRRGYCATVKENLADIAQVFYVDENCRSTQFVIFSLEKWAEMFDRPELVDIVHFNCGHWDVAHWNGYSLSLTSEDEYAKNIQMIITLLRRFFPNAQLVFATTTPMNPDGGSIGGINPRSNESIEKYNKIASRIAM